MAVWVSVGEAVKLLVQKIVVCRKASWVSVRFYIVIKPAILVSVKVRFLLFIIYLYYKIYNKPWPAITKHKAGNPRSSPCSLLLLLWQVTLDLNINLQLLSPGITILYYVIWVDLVIDNASRYQSGHAPYRSFTSRFTNLRYNGMILFRASLYYVLISYRRSMFRVLLSRRQFSSICSLIAQYSCLQWYVVIITRSTRF